MPEIGDPAFKFVTGEREGAMSTVGLVLQAVLRADGGWVSLFDGKTLDGWKNPYTWGEATVTEGEIRLKANKKFFLVSEKSYGDFVFEAEIKMPEGKANSGFMFRCHVARNSVTGYQAEVDPSDRKWAGGLYDEGRRKWLNSLEGQPEKQAAFDRAAWNKYRIECVGDRLRIWVNEVLTTDYRDPVDVAGPVALQHHGEKGKVYRFRNIRIKELGRHAWKPLFNGTSLEGWDVLPGGTWEVKDGVITGTTVKADKHHGLILSKKQYGDFTARLKFRIEEGDSGFYFRVEKVKGTANAHGMQAQISGKPDTGGLYELGGRKWLGKPKPEDMKKWYKPGEWATMCVSAHGGWIVVHVNDRKTVELRDDPGRKEGYLGLQLHARMDMKVEFKDLEILEPVK